MVSLALTERFFGNYIAWIPRIGICLLLPYVCFDFGGHHYRPETIFRFFTLIFSCFWLLIPFRKLPQLSIIKYPLISFLIFSLLSSIFSAYVHDSLLEWSNLICYTMIFIMVFDLLSSPRSHYVFIHYLLMICFAVCCTGLFFMQVVYKDNAALHSTFYQIDVFGGFVLLFFPVTLALYLSDCGEKPPVEFRGFRSHTVEAPERAASAIFSHRETIMKTLLYGLSSAMFGTCIVLTFSRGVIISLVAAVIIFYLLIALKKVKYSSYRLIITKSIVLLLIILVGAKLMSREKSGVVPERLKNRAIELVSEQDTSRQARLQFWYAAIQISRQRPLLGTGLKTFGRFYPPYEDDIRHFSKYPHNLYLQFLSELGWLATASFIVLIYFLFRAFFRQLRDIREGSFHYYSHFGIGIGGLASFFHHFVDVDWFFAAIPALWVALWGSSMGRALKYTHEGKEKEGAQGERDEDFLLKGLSRHMSIQFAACLFCMALAVLVVPSYFAKKYTELAEVLKDKGKIKEAIENYDIAIKLDPYDSENIRNLGNLYFLKYFSDSHDKASLELAEYYSKRAVELDPARAVLHHFLGRVFWAKNLPDEALKEYEQALALDGRNYPSFYNDIANYYMLKEDYAAAEKYYYGAVNLFKGDLFNQFWFFRADPTKLQLSETYEGLGNLYLKKRKYGEAETFFAKSVQLNPGNYTALFALGIAIYKQEDSTPEDLQKAIKILQRVTKIEPRFALAYLFTGYAYEKLGDKVESRKWIDNACEIDPGLKSRPPPK